MKAETESNHEDPTARQCRRRQENLRASPHGKRACPMPVIGRDRLGARRRKETVPGKPAGPEGKYLLMRLDIDDLPD